MRDSPTSRRDLLRLIAGGAALTLSARNALAGQARIDKLIVQAQVYPTVSQRIGYISAALRGSRYRGYTLIGGPHRPEKFVVRDDVFDCVTYLETVLAAADARKPEQTSRTCCARSATTTARSNGASAIIISSTGASAMSTTACAAG